MKNPLLLLAPALLLATGCETLYSSGRGRTSVSPEQQQAARIHAERQEQAREVALLRARSEGTSVAMTHIEERLDALERQSAQNDALRAKVDRLQQEIDALRAEQEASRRQIVNDLSAEIQKAFAESPQRRAPAGGSSGSGYEHVVQAGETLSAIAAAYGCPVKRIMDANNIRNANQIRAGQKLFIPD
ncbi:MAG: LysM peptidoglycan-binding domain-containing protein [Kiritimatiellia bacterium]|jgi:nucleoid-associated protein YgaU